VSGTQVSIAEVAQFLSQSHALKCDCCRGEQQAVMAVWEPPNKLVIRRKTHNRWHVLTLRLAVPRGGGDDPLHYSS
jgi:hypothetical protein